MKKQLLNRDEIEEKYKWKLEDIYESDVLWEEELSKANEIVEQISKFQGTLASSAQNLLDFFKESDNLDYYVDRVYVYANQRYHQDTTVSKYQGYAANAELLLVNASGATSFANPELLEISDEKFESFYQEKPELLKYKRLIDEIKRTKDHVLDKKSEEILAKAGEIAMGPDNIFHMFNDADIKFPKIKDENGNEVELSHGNFIHYMQSYDRRVREDAFKCLYSSYKAYGNTVSAIFTSNLKQENFYSQLRNYSSSRAMELDKSEIPESVYDNLIETVHKHLPALHKYLKDRKNTLNVDKLHMYDIYVPLVQGVEKEYSFEEAKEIVADALQPMGDEYVSILKEGMNSRWIDVYENRNKRSGAYSWGAYGTHPYVLLNYHGKLNDVFTLAHEMGHSMHTYFSNKNQPITYAGYKIFVAEVASTCNEALLMHYMLEKTDDVKIRKYLLNHQLEEFRTTLFRQTMFAEFEHIVHSKIQAGEALTMEKLNKIYHDLNVLYYGEDMVVDEEIDYEWMRIPHFYTPFYVYQYATGYSAATAFAKIILEGKEEAANRYIKEFLCGGSSKSPIELLKAAGVDMSSSEPVDKALESFEEYLKEYLDL
ncbi:oligoendopeptidase F [Lachnobacterium bovis]|uniref:Oligopeptidase F n=1 Tax=Lachnobacterium bovis DSM 14045 TaxID=1122142 RepID=A0A1H3LTQ3_9FIRM|nr:oligoendopeptidase F [Lachnobacterium bovis]SDY67781.1 oligoendopeptidase F [Lachnobacterium bovis DSM 14045]